MAIYYVDPSGGNNGNSGLRPDQPWLDEVNVNAGSFVAGDVILFKRGTTLRGLLDLPNVAGTASDPIVFGAYGSGAKPKFSGADIQTGWADAGSNRWTVTLAADPNQVFFDNVRGTRETVVTNVDAPNEWHWTATTLTVFSVGSPTQTIEASVRQYAFREGQASFVKVIDLVAEKALDDGWGIFGAPTSETDWSFLRCEARDNYGVGFQTNQIGGVVRHDSCVSTNNGAGMQFTQTDGFVVMSATITNNRAQNDGDGINVATCDNWTISGVTIEDHDTTISADGIQVSASNGFLIESCNIMRSGNADIILSSASQGDIRLCNLGSADDGPRYHAFIHGAAGETKLTRCSMLGNPTQQATRLESLAGTFVHSMNTYKNATSIAWSKADAVTAGSVTSDNNVFDAIKTEAAGLRDLVFFGGSTYVQAGFADYVSEQTQDAGSLKKTLETL